MHIVAYNDKQSGWGKQLIATARLRGHSTELLGLKDALPTHGYFYARVEQFSPLHKPSKEFALKATLVDGVKSIIDRRELWHYERKDLQAIDFAYGGMMPDTFVCNNEMQADRAINRLGFPIVSKAAFGSSSSNVRLLKNEDDALAEARQAFTPEGLPVATGQEKRGRQQGYVIWQRFLPGNAYVYRCAIVGRWLWLLQVFNRKDAPFASGSGNYTPVSRFDSEALGALSAAHDFFKHYGMRWCAVDMARDPFSGAWQVLETTIAWNMRAPTANAACPIVNRHGTQHPKGYHGRDMWPLLLEELEAGVFG